MAGRGELRGRRWLSIALRTVHLVGVVAAAVAALGHGSVSVPAVLAMLVTGVGLYAIELTQHRDFWKEAAGVFVVVKLLLLGLMLLAPGIAVAIFWIVLVASSVVSHAPRVVRHYRLIGRRPADRHAEAQR